MFSSSNQNIAKLRFEILFLPKTIGGAVPTLVAFQISNLDLGDFFFAKKTIEGLASSSLFLHPPPSALVVTLSADLDL